MWQDRSSLSLCTLQALPSHRKSNSHKWPAMVVRRARQRRTNSFSCKCPSNCSLELMFSWSSRSFQTLLASPSPNKTMCGLRIKDLAPRPLETASSFMKASHWSIFQTPIGPKTWDVVNTFSIQSTFSSLTRCKLWMIDLSRSSTSVHSSSTLSCRRSTILSASMRCTRA